MNRRGTPQFTQEELDEYDQRKLEEKQFLGAGAFWARVPRDVKEQRIAEMRQREKVATYGLTSRRTE